MAFEILRSDQFFYDSPDPGDEGCICSRCGVLIEVGPVIRAWPTKPGEHGWDEYLSDSDGAGTEFRFCRECLAKMGVSVGANETE